MNHFIGLLIMGLLLSSCVKEEVTNIVPDGSMDRQSEDRHIVQGTINGGGGKGVLCKKGPEPVVEVLDLYEAKALYGRKIIDGPDTQEGAIKLFAQLLAKHLWNPGTIPMDEYVKGLEEQLVTDWLNNIRFIEPGKKLKLIDDSFELLVEEGCEMVQVAAYYDQSILLIDQSYWNQMDWMNRIGLLAHELIYYFEREDGATNSVSTRKFVGHLFSEEGLRPHTDGVPRDERLSAQCGIKDGLVDLGYSFVFESKRAENKGLEMVFTSLPGHSSMFRVSTFMTELTMADFFDPARSLSVESDLEVDTYSTPTREFFLHTTEDGKRQVTLFNKRTKGVSGPYELHCDPPSTEEDRNTEVE